MYREFEGLSSENLKAKVQRYLMMTIITELDDMFVKIKNLFRSERFLTPQQGFTPKERMIHEFLIRSSIEERHKFFVLLETKIPARFTKHTLVSPYGRNPYSLCIRLALAWIWTHAQEERKHLKKIFYSGTQKTDDTHLTKQAAIRTFIHRFQDKDSLFLKDHSLMPLSCRELGLPITQIQNTSYNFLSKSIVLVIEEMIRKQMHTLGAVIGSNDLNHAMGFVIQISYPHSRIRMRFFDPNSHDGEVKFSELIPMNNLKMSERIKGLMNFSGFKPTHYKALNPNTDFSIFYLNLERETFSFELPQIPFEIENAIHTLYPQWLCNLGSQIDDFKCFKIFLDIGLNLNIKTPSGTSLLIIASAYGNLEIVKALLQISETDVNQKDNGENTALHAAADLNQAHILNELLKVPNIQINALNDIKITPFMLACVRESLDSIDILIKYVDVNRPVFGGSLLHLLVHENAILSIQKLLRESDIDINAKNEKGLTALELAESLKRTEIVTVIQESLTLRLG